MVGLGPAILRLALAAVFVAHGLPKLVPVWGRGPAATATFFESIGLVPGYPLALAVGVLELAGGLLLLVGLLTFWATLMLSLDMLAALWLIHLPSGFFYDWSTEAGTGRGVEFPLVLVAALLCLMLTGAGSYSLDHRRARSAEAEALGRARLRRSS